MLGAGGKSLLAVCVWKCRAAGRGLTNRRKDCVLWRENSSMSSQEVTAGNESTSAAAIRSR
jgi:hypothetical protein